MRSNQPAAEVFQVPELLHHTFTSLPLPSLAACARVNRSWFEIAIEHLWKSVNLPSFLRLTSCGSTIISARQVRRNQPLPPSLYEFHLPYAEAKRLCLYSLWITTLEYSFHEEIGPDGGCVSLSFYFDLLLDAWTNILRDHPSLLHLPDEAADNITVARLFPRLRFLKGSTSPAATEGCPSNEFLLPIQPMLGLLQPLTRIYSNSQFGLSLIATGAAELVLDTLDLRPSIFLEFKRNRRLRHLEFTRRSRRIISDDWDKIKLDSGWTREDLVPDHIKPPLRHLTLRAFDVGHLFTKLMDHRMFGPVTHIKFLRLQNFNRAIRRYSSFQSMSSRSDYVPRLVDTEDEVDNEPETSFNDFDTANGISSSPVAGPPIPNGHPTPLTSEALALVPGNASDPEPSRHSSTTRSADDTSQVNLASPPRSVQPSSSSDDQSDNEPVEPPVYSDSDSNGSEADDIEALYPLGFSNFFGGFFNSEEDDSYSEELSWIGTDEGSQLEAAPAPNRILLELIASSCPELEILILEEFWDWDQLLSRDTPAPVPLSNGELENSTEGVSNSPRMLLRLDFRDVSDPEERADTIACGIKRLLKQKENQKDAKQKQKKLKREI